MTLIHTNTHRVTVQAHTRRAPDKPRPTDWLHTLLRLEVELEAVLAENMREPTQHA